MSNYTLYNIESLELKGIVDTLLPIEHYLDDNTLGAALESRKDLG